jgi:7,8-dihydropterin-6-yl-methyl-4-(beta-D-ribofuranosyl)aminobenzene 5'-phosphate synthase
MARRIVSGLAAAALAAAIGVSAASAQTSTAQITVLYDAFGKTSTLTKDWGFAALIEYGGKRILFDTGNNTDIFAHNVEAKGVDLTQLDFAVVSHRHGDHTSGLNHLLRANPAVKIYAPQENFGVFGAALPGSFYRRNDQLPTDMRYFDGKPPDTLRFGTPWPEGNFTWITKTTEVAAGFHLILLNGTWGVDLEVREISLAIDTPDGIVLIVGCSHPTIEKIVEAAKAVINKPIHLVLGGLHLLPAKDDQITGIAASLRLQLRRLLSATLAAEGKSLRDTFIVFQLGQMSPSLRCDAEVSPVTRENGCCLASSFVPAPTEANCVPAAWSKPALERFFLMRSVNCQQPFKAN